jgi:hypothetical protein
LVNIDTVNKWLTAFQSVAVIAGVAVGLWPDAAERGHQTPRATLQELARNSDVGISTISLRHTAGMMFAVIGRRVSLFPCEGA